MYACSGVELHSDWQVLSRVLGCQPSISMAQWTHSERRWMTRPMQTRGREHCLPSSACVKSLAGMFQLDLNLLYEEAL